MLQPSFLFWSSLQGVVLLTLTKIVVYLFWIKMFNQIGLLRTIAFALVGNLTLVRVTWG